MNIRKIAICDDDRKTQDLLYVACESYYKEKNQKILIKNFDTGEELLAFNQKFDYILLDVEMSDLNGIEVAEKIRETDIDTMIVIISGYPKYKNRAYSAHVFDYIDKPVNKSRIFRLFDELERYLAKKQKKTYISFKTTNGIIQLDRDDILLLEYYDRKISIQTINNKYCMYGKISELAIRLEKYNFIFPHRAYIVNMSYIEKIDGNNIILSTLANDNTIIPISKLKKKEVYDLFYKYLSNEADKV